MIKYTNICIQEYNKLSYKKRKKTYCIEYTDGTKEWIVNGKLHREDDPAIEFSDGSKAWYINGKLHREDGPAIEPNGNRWYPKRHNEWCLNDIIYTFEEWLEKLNKTDEEKILLKLKYS